MVLEADRPTLNWPQGAEVKTGAAMPAACGPRSQEDI